MRDKLYCLMTSSVSLDDRMADVLFDTACIMIKNTSGRKVVKDVGFEGQVTTKFNTQILGSISGVEFFAEVETELGKGKGKFLVKEVDAKLRGDLVWVPFFSIEDLMEGLDSSPSRLSPRCN